LPGNGSIFVGSKDTLYVPNYWGRGSFLSGKKMEDFTDVPVAIPRSWRLPRSPRTVGWGWTGVAGWRRGASQGCPGRTASGRATGKAGGSVRAPGAVTTLSVKADGFLANA
jgi:hypothetical protein